MIDSNLKIKVRTRPFFGRWNNCGLFYLPECHTLRKLDHQHIDKVIRVRRDWNHRIVNYGGSWFSRNNQEITDQSVENLHAICDFLLTDNTDRKIIIHPDHLYVYTNDESFYDRITQTNAIKLIEKTRVSLAGTPGAVQLKNPSHKLRTYFHNRRMDVKTADSVFAFLENQPDIKLSPSLKNQMNARYRVVKEHMFIDHNDSGIIIMLSMIVPNMIRKTVSIETAK